MIHQIMTKFFLFYFGFLSLMMQSCASSKTPADNFPAPNSYPNYELIDARYTTTLALNAKQNTKLAIVVKDLSVTAFTNLEMPIYDKKIVTFEGVERCCLLNERLIGSSGLLVYKFNMLRKGNTKIQLIARHKGLSTTAEHFDSDLVTTITVNVE